MYKKMGILKYKFVSKLSYRGRGTYGKDNLGKFNIFNRNCKSSLYPTNLSDRGNFLAIRRLSQLYVSFFRKGCSFIIGLLNAVYGTMLSRDKYIILNSVLDKLFSSPSYVSIKSISKGDVLRCLAKDSLLSVGRLRSQFEVTFKEAYSILNIDSTKVESIRRRLKYYFKGKISSKVSLSNHFNFVYGRNRNQYQGRACTIILYFFCSKKRTLYSKLLRSSGKEVNSNLYYSSKRYSKNYLDMEKRIKFNDVSSRGKEFSFLLKNSNISLGKKFLFSSRSKCRGYSSLVRNRCYYTSRSNSVLSFFKFSRIVLKKLASEGKLVGVVKVD